VRGRESGKLPALSGPCRHARDGPFPTVAPTWGEACSRLEAQRRGRPEIAFGNVVGSTLAFFLFNGGLVALARPVLLSASTATFYLPVAFVTVVGISGLMLRKAVPRWAGAVLVGLYLAFVVGGYLVDRAAALGAVG